MFVVLAMPALLMMGSLVFDGARGILGARQAQNSADAAALAKATDCSQNNTGTDVSGYATNGTALVSASCDTTSYTATATMDSTQAGSALSPPRRPKLTPGFHTITEFVDTGLSGL